MLKANLNLKAKDTKEKEVPVTQLVDNNGKPYEMVWKEEVDVDIYGFKMKATVEGRVYERQGNGKYLKCSIYVHGALVKEGEERRPYILGSDLNPSLPKEKAIGLALINFHERLYNTKGKDGMVANISLLGAVGAKFDNAGYPIFYQEEVLEVNPSARVGDVVSVRILYTLKATNTYITAYPTYRMDNKVYARDEEGEKVSLVEKPFNTVDFISNSSSIRDSVHQVIFANFGV